MSVIGEVDIYMYEEFRDTGCIVKYLHFVTALLWCSYYKQRGEAAPHLLSRETEVLFMYLVVENSLYL